MRIVIGQLSIRTSRDAMISTKREVWVKEMVKVHEGMGVDVDTLSQKLGEAYDLVSPPKTKSPKAEEVAK